VKPRFSRARIDDLEPRIRAWAREALASWLEAGGGNFVPVAEVVPARAVGYLLGLPDGDVERHRIWAMMGGEMLAGDINPSGLRDLAGESAGMTEYIGHHLEAAMAGEHAPAGASLLQLLAGGVSRGQVTKSEATGIALVMFGAGGESTSSLIGSAIRLLAEDPDLARRLREETDLIPRFVEEAMRLEPPFKFHYRTILRDCELAGYELHPGDRLMLLWAAANRDPAIFVRPDDLMLDRKHPKHHMSFGRGAHFCVGEQLARLEARVMIEEVLAATEGFGLDPEALPIHARSIFVRRLEELPIVVS
jgi:cytochrome P450